MPSDLDSWRQWNGEPLGANLKHRPLRELERLELLTRQIRSIEAEQAARIRDDRTHHVAKLRRLMGLKGVGQTTATILVYEFFGWRRFANRREVAALAGLTPTPYQSGESNHEQGISKAGNVWIRWIMVELAWSWLRFQPDSPLSQWYHRMTAAKVRLAMAAMGQKETKVADLCSELGVTRQTLYRHVAPNGTLRKDGSRVVEGGKNRKPQGKKP